MGAGARYVYLLDGERRRPTPPRARSPTACTARRRWSIRAPSLAPRRRAARRSRDYVIYELHVGTFTPRGHLRRGRARELERLVELGRHRGRADAGGRVPRRAQLGLRRRALVRAASSLRRPRRAARGWSTPATAAAWRWSSTWSTTTSAPRGTTSAEFGPYFTERHHTPWGDALDYDGADARAVRAQVARQRAHVGRASIASTRCASTRCTPSSTTRRATSSPSWRGCACIGAARPAIHVIAESDLGDVQGDRGRRTRGWGCDAQWSDDLHHALHAAVTGERERLLRRLRRRLACWRARSRDGFVYTGSIPRYREAARSARPSKHLPGERFVVCAQNHDQVGNRALRRAAAASWRRAASTRWRRRTSPRRRCRMLFMGEEHAEPAPFLYFTDHQDPALARAVREGRRREFGSAGGAGARSAGARAPSGARGIDLALGDGGRHAGGAPLVPRAALPAPRARCRCARSTRSARWSAPTSARASSRCAARPTRRRR